MRSRCRGYCEVDVKKALTGKHLHAQTSTLNTSTDTHTHTQIDVRWKHADRYMFFNVRVHYVVFFAFFDGMECLQVNARLVAK